MKKNLFVVLAILAVVFCAVSCSKTQETTATTTTTTTTTATTEPTVVGDASKPVAKIGVVTTLDAEGKISGYYHQVAMDMIRDEVKNAKDLNASFEFIFRDFASDPATLKQRMSELKSLGCCAIVALCADDFGPAAAQWASENKTPVLFAANYSTQMSIVNYSDYIFATGLNAWGFIKVLAQEAVGKYGYKTFAYVGTDGAGAIDAENLLLYEGQKINPAFRELKSYKMSHTDTEFSTIVSTILSGKEIPDMTLQQGGYNVLSFISQAAMYDFYGKSTIWSDVVIMPSIVQSLYAAGVYSFKGSFGASTFAWWDPKFADFYADYKTRCQAIGNTDAPMDFVLYGYWAAKAAVEAINATAKAGEDFNNGDVLTKALEKVEFESCGTKHSFRDFDHQLSMDVYFIEATDSGEANNHYPIPADLTAVFTAEQYLPSKAEMKEYAEKTLKVFNRF